MNRAQAEKQLDTKRQEAFETLSASTAATLAAGYDRARTEKREVIWLADGEPHSRSMSTSQRAERLRAALSAKGVVVLDD